MTLSAAFTVEGDANPAAHHVAYGSTVDLALTSTDGATSIVWEIMGCSEPTEPIPTLTTAGSPSGATASFTFPADSGDTLGRTFLVRCVVSNQVRGADGAYQQAIEYAVIGAENSQGELPIVPGEKNYRHSTHGWAPEINRALNNSGGGGGGGSGGGGWTDDGTVVRLTASSDSVAIGTASLAGTEKLRVIGNSRFEQATASSGAPKLLYVAGAAHTALTASAEIVDVDFALDRTVQHGTGAVTNQRAFVVRAPTYSFVGASTITNAATLAIVSAPSAGTNATITNNYALWVQAGAVRLGALTAGVVLASSTGVLSQQAYGSALQVFRMNAGGTGVEFASVSNLTAPSNPGDDGKVAVAAAGNLSYTLLSNAHIATTAQISLSKLADMATDRLLGRDTAGTGSPEVLTVGGGIEFTGSGGIQRSALTGDITATAGSNTTAITAGAIVDADINSSAAISLSKLATQAALSVVANATNGVAVPTTVAAGSDLQVFMRSGTTLVFGNIVGGSITDGTITVAKLANLAAYSVLGNATNASAAPAAISAVTEGHVLRLSGTTLGFGSLVKTTVAPNVETSGSPFAFKVTGAAHTTLAASTEAVDVDLSLGRTVQFATGALTAQRAVVVRAPTYAFVGASTLTDAATFAIAAAPIAGTNATITNAYSFWVQGGLSRFDDNIAFGATVVSPVLRQQTDATATVTGDTFTINAQDCSGNTAVTAGGLTLRGGDATGAGGTHTGGNLTLRAGNASGASGTRNGGGVFITAGTGATLNGGITLTATSGTITNACSTMNMDVTGTLTLSTLSGIGVVCKSSQLVFHTSTTAPSFTQVAAAAATATGQPLTIGAQDCAGTTSVTGGLLTLKGGDATGASGTRNGGGLVLRSGTGANSDGNVTIQRGTTQFIQLANVSSGSVLSLLRTAGTITSTQMPTNTGDGVIYLSAATTAPTAAPVGGAIVYSNSSGEFVTVSTNGTTQNMKLGDGTRGVEIKAGGATADYVSLFTGAGANEIRFTGGYVNFDNGGAAPGSVTDIRYRGVTYFTMSATFGAIVGSSSMSTVRMDVAGGTMLEVTTLATNREILSLMRGASLSTTQMPANTGDGVVYLANATTEPTTGAPVSGGILWMSGGSFKYRGTSSGTTAGSGIWSLAPNSQWSRYYAIDDAGTTNSTSITTIGTIDTTPLPDNCAGIAKAWVYVQDATNALAVIQIQVGFIINGGTLLTGGAGAVLSGSTAQGTPTFSYSGNNLLVRMTSVDAVSKAYKVFVEFTYAVKT